MDKTERGEHLVKVVAYALFCKPVRSTGTLPRFRLMEGKAVETGRLECEVVIIKLSPSVWRRENAAMAADRAVAALLTESISQSYPFAAQSPTAAHRPAPRLAQKTVTH